MGELFNCTKVSALCAVFTPRESIRVGPEKDEVQNVDMARPRSTALTTSASEPWNHLLLCVLLSITVRVSQQMRSFCVLGPHRILSNAELNRVMADGDLRLETL